MTETVIQEQTEEVVEAAKKALTPKGIARFVVGSSVKFAVASSLATLVPTETRTEKLKFIVASYAISHIVADKAKEFISEDIDEKVAFAREVYGELKKLEAAKTEQ